MPERGLRLKSTPRKARYFTGVAPEHETEEPPNVSEGPAGI